MTYQHTWNISKGAALVALGFAIATCTAIAKPDRTAAASNVVASVNKMVEEEGRLYMRAMSMGQQASWIEFAKFAKTIDDLRIGITSETQNYRYAIDKVDDFSARMTATAKIPGIKSYVASVFGIGEKDLGNSVAIICATETPSQTSPAPPLPSKSGSPPTCAAGSSLVDRL